MEHVHVLIMNQGGLKSIDSHLGAHFGGMFIISEQCYEALSDIDSALSNEDKQQRPFRRQMYTSGLVHKSLIPVLESLYQDENEDVEEKEEILNLTLKILAHITQPPDCLLDYGPALSSLRPVISDIVNLVHTIKQTFLKPATTKAILHHLQLIIQEGDGELDSLACDTISNALFLFRNLLYDSNDKPTKLDTRQHSSLLKLMLENNVQDLLLYCVNSPQSAEWHLSVIQLITLMYQGPHQSFSTAFSVMPTASSKASDHVTDSVYSSIALSESNESDEDQKDETASSSSVDGVHGSCAASDMSIVGTISPAEYKARVQAILIREKLRELSVSLLQTGCTNLLFGVKAILASKNPKNLTSLYFSWNLSFYVMMAQQHNVPFTYIKELVSVYTIDYLVYICVSSCEKLLQAQKRREPVRPIIREVNLALIGIKHIFNCLDYYSNTTSSTDEDKTYIKYMQSLFSRLVELRQMFVLLIRHYQPNVHPLHYLKLLVRLNHRLLTMAESCGDKPFDMLAHVQSFATKHMMSQYAHLLARAGQCSSALLDEVFTMMNHVAVGLRAPHTLLQLPIMQAMCEMEQHTHRLSTEAQGLIEYIFGLFVEQAANNPVQCAQQFLNLQPEDMQRSEDSDSTWSGVELEMLLEACVACSTQEQDDISQQSLIQISRHLEGKQYTRSPEEIVAQIRQQGWLKKRGMVSPSISDPVVCSMGSSQDSKSCPSPEVQLQVEWTSKFMPADQTMNSPDSSPSPPSTVDELLSATRDADRWSTVEWIQRSMLELCYIKLGGRQLGHGFNEEPVTLHHVLRNLPLPLVPYTERQETALSCPTIQRLLQALDIVPGPSDIYPRIPEHWDPRDLVSKAEQLKPLNWDTVKFTEEDVKRWEVSELSSSRFQFTSNLPEEKQPSSGGMWMMYVNKVNKNNIGARNNVFSSDYRGAGLLVGKDTKTETVKT